MSFMCFIASPIIGALVCVHYLSILQAINSDFESPFSVTLNYVV